MAILVLELDESSTCKAWENEKADVLLDVRARLRTNSWDCLGEDEKGSAQLRQRPNKVSKYRVVTYRVGTHRVVECQVVEGRVVEDLVSEPTDMLLSARSRRRNDARPRSAKDECRLTACSTLDTTSRPPSGSP